MIYMAGDNNLAVDMAYAMEQIKGVADESADSPNLFVYYDGNSPAIPTLYCDFSEPGNRAMSVPTKFPTNFMRPTKKQMRMPPMDVRSLILWTGASIQ